MVLCSAVNITKSYGERKLLNDVSLFIKERDKIGIVGINGTGKSTLLKIIAEAETPDAGTLTKAAALRIGYLPQNPVYEENCTTLEQVFKGASEAFKQAKAYEAKTILTKLGIADFDKDVRSLSGGEKKRVSIASALIQQSDLLILDEPTNHLDSEMVSWLEKYLQKYNGAILMVTHDRYFLDRVVTKIVEIDQGTIFSYDANYAKFLEMKAQREEMAIGSERKRKSLLNRELEWIQRGPRARGTKSKSRIERFEQLRDKDGPATPKRLDLDSVATRLGKKIVNINRISFGFGDRLMIRDFEYNILRDDRVGIIGSNGCGKTTLLNMIKGDLKPQSGTIEIGDTVKIGYFSQECEEMDPAMRVIDYIRETAENIVTNDGVLSASQMLEKFLFSADEQWTNIGRLSGGEKRRLSLLKTIMEAPNVLLLDEPSNDLDIMTLMILEGYLESFKGAVIVVSHDRYFLDKVVDKVFVFQQDGILRQYIGGYSDYMQQLEENPIQPSKALPKRQPVTDARFDETLPKKVKFTFKEQQEYGIIESVIADLEQQLDLVKTEIKIEQSNYIRLQALTDKERELETALNEKMERWLYLNDIAQRISAK